MVVHKKLIAAFLAGLMTLTAARAPLVWAKQGTEVSDTDMAEIAATQAEAEFLSYAFEGLSNEDYFLDVFHLLRQTVNDEDIRAVQLRIQKIQKADPAGEDVEDFIDRDIPAKKYFRHNLKIAVLTSAGDLIRTIDEKKADGVFVRNYSGKDSLYWTAATDRVFFHLTDRSGKILHKFDFDIQAVGFFGRFLVFIEKNKYDTATYSLPVRFINLEYFRGAIGNAALPVFTLPIKVPQPVTQFEIKNGKLVVNGKPLTDVAFQAMSHVYQLIFNLAVGLVDFTTRARTETLVQELMQTFSSAIINTDTLMRTHLENAVDGTPELRNLLYRFNLQTLARSQLPTIANQTVKMSAHPAAVSIFSEKLFQESLLRANRSLQATQAFATRLNMLMAKLASPRPYGSPKLIQSLAMLAEGMRKRKADEVENAKYQIRSHPYWKYIKYGSLAVAGAVIGQNLPEPVTLDLMNTFDLIARAAQNVKDYVVANDQLFFRYVAEGTGNAGESILDFPETWLNDGKWKNALVGIGGGLSLLFTVFATMHFCVNSVRAGRYVAQHWRDIHLSSIRGWDRFKRLFMDYRHYENDDIAEELMAAQQALTGDVELTPEEEEEKNRLLAQLEVKEKAKDVNAVRNIFARFFHKVGYQIGISSSLLGAAGYTSVRIGDAIEASAARLTRAKNLDTFAAALRDFLFSYVSVMHTVRFLGILWTYWTPMRAYLWRPTIWYLLLRYPNFFRTTVMSTPGEVHLPTEYNGGLRTRSENTDLSLTEEFGPMVRNLKTFEKLIIPYEREIFSIALQRAILALISYVEDPQRILQLFESTELTERGLSSREILETARASTGIRDINDPKLKQLSETEQVFFRAYFTKYYDLSMQQFLRLFIGKHGETVDHSVSKPKDLVKRALPYTADLELDPSHIDSIRAELENLVNRHIHHNAAYAFAKESTSQIMRLIGDIKINTVYRGVEILDPSSAQMRLFHTAKRQLNNPRAVLRAARHQISHVFISVPMQLAGIMLLYNTVDYGLLQPLYPEAFSDNSFLHLNKYLFVEGFLLGTIQSFMSGPRMKVLRDARLDEKKAFDKVPTKFDRDRGFWRYFWKCLRHPKNRWWQNQLYTTQILLANIPAAMATYVITNLIALGRIDVGLILGGYIAALMTPYIGAEQKVDQAFEMATSHVSAQIPKKYRALPEFQNWINREIQSKRNRFNFFYQMGGELWQAISNLTLYQPQPEVGSRGLMRLIFGGYEPVELLAKGLRKVSQLFDDSPIVASAARACEELFTNNYVDWQKIPSTEEYWGSR